MRNQVNKNQAVDKYLKYLLYPLLGLIVFYGNSQLEFNYFIKGYLSLLELQLGALIIYWMFFKRKSNNS